MAAGGCRWGGGGRADASSAWAVRGRAWCVLCACVAAAPAADDDARTCGAGVAAAATRGRTVCARTSFRRCRLPRPAPRDLKFAWPVGTASVPAAGAVMLRVGAASKLPAASRAEGTARRGAWVWRRWHRAVHGMSARKSCVGKKKTLPNGEKHTMYCYNQPPSSSSRHQSHTATQGTRHNPLKICSTTRTVRGLGSSKQRKQHSGHGYVRLLVLVRLARRAPTLALKRSNEITVKSIKAPAVRDGVRGGTGLGRRPLPAHRLRRAARVCRCHRRRRGRRRRRRGRRRGHRQ